MSGRLVELTEAGVSIWLDDLSRERIASGNLAELIAEKQVRGVTTNPTIFAAAISEGDSYQEQIAGLGDEPVESVIQKLTTTDVANACALFQPLYDDTAGVDGRVSIEVDPRLAMESGRTVTQARELYDAVGYPNVLIKIPATQPGLSAIRETIAHGISVNVTLIFSVERYRDVMDAYLSGLEDALAAGVALESIHSVASFFVSRVDAEVDKRLDAIGTDAARALKGKAALANARLAFAAFTEAFSSERFWTLKAQGANVQRPLWASTSVKNPDYPDTMYVSELVVANSVNTMPEKTLDAFADHGDVSGDTVSGREDEAAEIFASLGAVGVDLDDVWQTLEREGVQKFEASWTELMETVAAAQQ